MFHYYKCMSNHVFIPPGKKRIRESVNSPHREYFTDTFVCVCLFAGIKGSDARFSVFYAPRGQHRAKCLALLRH